jgi:pilus assembly protein CpaB
MLFRNLLLILGALFILAGAALGVVWLKRGPQQPDAASNQAAANAPSRLEILSATRAIPSGTLLQEGDIGWKDIDQSQLRPGNLVRGQASEAEFLGAVTTREFANGEAFIASELIKLGASRFLSAVLKPGKRAVSIFVDAAQSSSGLIIPGNHVDVILTQSFGDSTNNGKKQSVAETVLEDVRIIAVDQTLSQHPKTGLAESVSASLDNRLPKTVTLEVTARQAEILSVAEKLGQLQISVRPFENAVSAGAANKRPSPAWGGDVSSALRDYAMRLAQEEARKAAEEAAAQARMAQNQAKPASAPEVVSACKPGQRQPCGTGSTLEASVRWPPLAIYPPGGDVRRPAAEANEWSAND